MNKPYWYKVLKHETTFLKYEETSDVNLYIKNFILSSIYNHDLYQDNIHIFSQLFMAEEKSPLLYFLYFLYNISIRSVINDPLIYEINQTALKNRFLLFPKWSKITLTNWIYNLYYIFFDITPIKLDFESYDKNNIEQMKNIFDMIRRHESVNILHIDRKMKKLYNIYIFDKSIREFIDFLKGKSFPSYIKRDNKEFFKSVVAQYWPPVLNVLNAVKPFDDEELSLIKSYHEELYKNYNIDFVMEYYEMLKKYNLNKITKDLENFLNGNIYRDPYLFKNFMLNIPIFNRSLYLPIPLLITDDVINYISELLVNNSLEKIMEPYLNYNKELIKNHVETLKFKLANELLFSTQNKIFIYPLSELVFYLEDDNHIYVFTKQELDMLRDKKENPFTRKKIPDNVFVNIEKGHISYSYEDLWSSILRRKINL